MTWGREAPEDECERMYQLARERGIRWFDTASLYQDGEAERILGRLLAKDPNREQVMISTKGGYRGQPLLEEVEKSCQRLGVDKVQAYYHHHWHRNIGFATPRTSPNEVYQQVLWDIPKVMKRTRMFGLSNCTAVELALAVHALLPIGCVQFHYNLFSRTAEVELVPLAKLLGLAMFGYSPLAAGILTHRLQPTPRMVEDKRYAKRYDRCGPGFVNPGDAVAWVEAKGVTPIVGARTAEQLHEVLQREQMTPDDAAVVEMGFRQPPHPLDRPEEDR